ncbi:unnamed protein product [Prunus brigantina]
MVAVSEVPTTACEAPSVRCFSSWLMEAYACITDGKGFIKRTWPRTALLPLKLEDTRSIALRESFTEVLPNLWCNI